MLKKTLINYYKNQNIKRFKWKPNKKDLLAIIISWGLVVLALSAATFIATPERGGLYFIFYGIIGAALIGIGIPVCWTIFVRKRPLADIGITTKNIKASVLAQIMLFVVLFLMISGGIDVPGSSELLPLLALAFTIGFFEAVFWRGWVLLRLEESFGLIPAIIGGSVLYAAYHIGYGMKLNEMVFLFFIGVMFAVVFRFTKFVFILWPLFQPLGQLITLIKDDLKLPTIAILGFIETFILMVVICWLAIKFSKKMKIKLTTE